MKHCLATSGMWEPDLLGIPKVEAQLLNYLSKSQLPKTSGEAPGPRAAPASVIRDSCSLFGGITKGDTPRRKVILLS